jgi:CHAT domain-containing protein
MKRALSFVLIFFVWLHARSQSIGEIIQLHRENLINLYSMRGAAPDWVLTADVSEDDIIRVLKEYTGNVGLLFYNFHQDTLQSFLFDKQGKIIRTNYPIEENVLIREIENANKCFSEKFVSRAPSKRGASLVDTHDSIESYQESYEHISMILLPFDQQLLKQFDHLIIVPTLNISIIPFSALKLSDEEFLIDLMSYSIAPSLYEFMVNRQMKVNRGIDRGMQVYYNFTNALFVANPKFPEDPLWNFPCLPGTEKEVNYITKKMDSSTYTKLIGKDANILNIRENICEYDLLYFATHGISEEDNPLDNSFLVLAEGNEKSFLSARDIQNIRYDCSLNADLVVLSACQTGLGKSHKAGLMGIARGFQIAGANHILMSLWNISDNETALLMGLFFDNLLKGADLMPHEALRQAILTYKGSINSNPVYWAAFSIFGIPY